jgi:predicted O-linked N-acetylglucosamine transferase (SPINDLY family)
LLRLPEVYMVYGPPTDAPEVGDLPAVRNGFPTFGSMNALSKISAPVVDLWSRILRGLPEARLLLVAVPDGRTRERISGLFAAQGVASTRLEMHDRLPQREFLDMHNRIDIALDPFPFSGTTTTCQSLWMGTPVITLAGRVHAARVTTGMLTSIGLAELVANSEDEYVNIATRLARNIGKMAELRGGMRQRMLDSPLTDAARFTLHLENAYRTVWKDRCGRQAQSTKAQPS